MNFIYFRACEALCQCLPDQLKDGTFDPWYFIFSLTFVYVVIKRAFLENQLKSDQSFNLKVSKFFTKIYAQLSMRIIISILVGGYYQGKALLSITKGH